MADTRYLRQRHQGWYFVAAVPRALRGKFVSDGRNGSAGRPLSKIVMSLKTQSLKRLEARPIATLSVEAQESHERRERVYGND